jgi:UDP-arabinose 4-epimerase
MATNPHILVTGGAGYIGSNVCHALAQNGFTPVAFDDLSAGDKDRVHWGPLVVGDIRDTAALRTCMQQYKPIAVIHLAGMISVGESVVNPMLAYSINTQGTISLLTAMRDEGVKTIIFSSTAAVYGIPSTDKVAESASHNPINPYGWSKLFAEQMIADAAHAHGIGFMALRYFNASGANLTAQLGYARAQPLHLIPLDVRAMLSGKPLHVFGTDYPTADGTAIRDYIHVEDLAEAHVLALRHSMAGKPNLQLNLGTSTGYSVQEVITQIEEIAGQTVPTTLAPRRAGDPACLVADASRAQQILNWQPKHSALKNIIETELAWHKSLSIKA